MNFCCYKDIGSKAYFTMATLLMPLLENDVSRGKLQEFYLWIAHFNIYLIFRKEIWVHYKGCVNLTSLYSVRTSITKTITNSFEKLKKLLRKL